MTLGTSTLATYSNPDKGTGYVQRTFTVAGQAGRTAILRFSHLTVVGPRCTASSAPRGLRRG